MGYKHINLLSQNVLLVYFFESMNESEWKMLCLFASCIFVILDVFVVINSFSYSNEMWRWGESVGGVAEVGDLKMRTSLKKRELLVRDIKVAIK